MTLGLLKAPKLRVSDVTQNVTLVRTVKNTVCKATVWHS